MRSLTSQPPTLEELFLRHYGARLEPHDHTGVPDPGHSRP